MGFAHFRVLYLGKFVFWWQRYLKALTFKKYGFFCPVSIFVGKDGYNSQSEVSKVWSEVCAHIMNETHLVGLQFCHTSQYFPVSLSIIHENNHLQHFCCSDSLISTNSLINKTFHFRFVAVNLKWTLFPSQPALLVLIWANSCIFFETSCLWQMAAALPFVMRVFSITNFTSRLPH